MKNYRYVLLMAMLYTHIVYAQVGGAKVNQWIAGVTGTVPPTPTQRIYFGSGTGVIENYDYGCGFRQNGVCISDLGGAIQFVTNGVVVMDAQGDTVQSAMDFNPAYWNPNSDPQLARNPAPTVIPDPGNPLRYYLFHYATRNTNLATLPPAGPWGATLIDPRYSLIDMSIGVPIMTVKNAILVQDSLQVIYPSQFVMTHHANGRDWWLLMPRYKQDSILTFLVSPNGISQPFVQSGLGAWTMFPTSVTQGSSCYMVFSADGTKLAVNRPRNGMSLYDFDRCTGLLSNRVALNYILPFDSIFSDDVKPIIFSPDSKSLYVVTPSNRMYQYRIDTTDINASALMLRDSLHPDYEIAGLANSPEEIPRLFCFRANTPAIDVIPLPNIRGAGCGFLEDVYGGVSFLNTFAAYTYYPNYALGPLIGSGCDTLTSSISTAVTAAKVQVYPNPTEGEITVAFEGQALVSGMFMCYNPLGQVCKAIDLAHSPSKVSLSDLPTGLYFWEFEGQKGKLWVR